MTAMAIYQIAVILFKLDKSLHKDDGVISWKLEDDSLYPYTIQEPDPPPTMFFHPAYTFEEQYPDRVADMVGY